MTTPSLSPKRDVTWPDSDTSANNFLHESRGKLWPFAFYGLNIILTYRGHSIRVRLFLHEIVKTIPLQINLSDEFFDGEYQKYF